MRAHKLETNRTLPKRSGSPHEVADRLLPLIYDELRALAHRYMNGERAGSTLDPTGLVHEAYISLVRMEHIDWKSKTHFYAIAATQMRRILVDRARRAGARKRGARRRRVELLDTMVSRSPTQLDVLTVDEALTQLEQRSPRQARVAELRLFAGMAHKEVACALGASERTVRSDWQVARAWLATELRPGQGSRGGDRPRP